MSYIYNEEKLNVYLKIADILGESCIRGALLSPLPRAGGNQFDS